MSSNFKLWYNFMSPVTGRILADEDHVLLGNSLGVAVPSPILIDLQLDLNHIRQDYNILRQADFIVGFPNEQLPNCQILSANPDGFIYNTAGIVSTYPYIPTDKLPPLNAININIGGFDYGIYEMWQGTSSGEATPSYDVWRNIVNFLYTFKTTRWVINKSGTLPIDMSLPFAQFINELPEERILTHTTDGIIGVATLTHKKLWQGDENNIPVEVLTIGVDNLPDLEAGRFWMGDGNNRPQETGLVYKNLIIGNEQDQLGFRETIYMENLPPIGVSVNPLILGKGKIFRGTESLQAEISDDLSLLELEVSNIKNIQIPAIEADIAALQGQITTIETTLYTPVTGLVSVVAGLSVAVAAIQTQIIAISNQLTDHENRIATLENQVVEILASIAAINTRIDELSITLEGDVTGTGNIGSPIQTTLELTLDQIKLAQNTVNLNDQRISNLKNNINDPTNAISFEMLAALLDWTAEVEWQQQV